MSDKQRFLAGLDIEEKDVFAKLYDRAQRAEKTGAAAFGEFLSMKEQSDLAKRRAFLPDAELTFFGGFDDAERMMAGFNAAEAAFPIAAVEITAKTAKALTHRDYLGSLMGLGVEREKLGDILVSAEGAVAFVHTDILEYVETNLASVGKFPVSVRRAELSGITVERRFEEKSGTVASLRLDNVCALFVGKGREAACELIRAGRVFVDGAQAEKADMKLTGGEAITVRGVGRAELTVGGRSKKDRIFITLKKYM